MSKNDYEKPDFWTQKAKKDGYPARSVYKLEEIDAKFKLLKKNMRILDVGAAPGSWSLWILRQFEKLDPAGTGTASLVAVDLSNLAIPETAHGFRFIKGDIFSDPVQASLTEGGPFDLIVSDAAPSTTGNSMVDTARSEELVDCVIGLCEQHLKPGGSLVCKFFIGGGQQEMLARCKALFATARTYKPEACRSSSFETYLIGLQKHAPDKTGA